jgi:hypothetical protein
MPFLTQGKTNWKYILIVLILAVIVGGGIFGYLRYFKREIISLTKFPEIKKPEKVEVTEELVNKIIDKIVLNTKKYDRRTAEFFIDDLDNDKKSEIIVCLASFIEEFWGPENAYNAYLVVVTPIDVDGNYKIIGDFTFSFNREERSYFLDTPFLGRPCIDDIKSLVDIDRDGKKEMIVNLGLLGVSGYAYTIFKIDWDSHKINRVKVRDKEGSIKDYYFVNAAAATHTAGFGLEDVDNDGIMEIVEVYSYLKDEERNCWEIETSVYKWDGSMFIYSETLSSSSLDCGVG